MWKDYSAGFIKNNRASSMSILAGAFISALFLSLLCSLFYNFWQYEVEQIILEEGDWQARIAGEISQEDLNAICNFPNVETAVINKALSGEQKKTADIRFYNPRTVFQDMPLLAGQLGLEEDAVDYHHLLLSRYFIYDPQDKEPPLLMVFFLLVLVLVSVSLVLIIHNSFAVSMNERVRQFGIFSSIGATPRQIRLCLVEEAAVLCFLPVLAGTFFGVALSFGIIQAINRLAADIAGRHEAVFQYHPLILAVTVLVSAFTIFSSAWLPAKKLSGMTPLEAISNGSGKKAERKKHSPVLALLFGIEGELAGNGLKVQKKALRTAALSLTLSYLGFILMTCFFTLSSISTRYTYFAKYQDAWDIMVTVKNTKIEDFLLAEKLQELEGAEDCAVYQKAVAAARIPKEWQSEELAALGGVGAVAGDSAKAVEGGWQVKAPIVILEDGAFMEYCRQIAVAPCLDGTIILNQIWDSLNSNFRYRTNIPYVKENKETIFLQGTGKKGKTVEIPVAAYTKEAPALKEEYAEYGLVQFMPLSLWKEIAGRIKNVEDDIYIRILAKERNDIEKIKYLEEQTARLVSRDYEAEIENRIQDKINNDVMILAYQILLGGICVLLALIGIANVFSNTLGFLHQRRREFAQYMSVGMAPAAMKKMFCVEALVIAGRPLLTALPFAAAAAGFMIRASYLDPMEFMAEAPVVPIAVFSLSVFGFVGLAYYIGGKRVLKCSLADALRADSMA